MHSHPTLFIYYNLNSFYKILKEIIILNCTNNKNILHKENYYKNKYFYLYEMSSSPSIFCVHKNINI